MAIGVVAFSVVYWGSAWLAWRPPAVLNPTSLDAIIPFAPLAVWAYLSEIPLLLVTIWIAGTCARTRALAAMVISLIAAAGAFVLFPAQVSRPAVDATGLTGIALAILHRVDTTGNALPSLHGAFAVIALLAMRRERALWRRIVGVWVVAILVAALVTKQHYVPDLLAGIFVGVVSFLIAARIAPTAGLDA